LVGQEEWLAEQDQHREERWRVAQQAATERPQRREAGRRDDGVQGAHSQVEVERWQLAGGDGLQMAGEVGGGASVRQQIAQAERAADQPHVGDPRMVADVGAGPVAVE